MTALLVGFAIGLLAAAVIGGYRIRRARALRDLENQIPAWVNQGGDIWLHTTIDDFINALHFIQWEDELEEQT